MRRIAALPAVAMAALLVACPAEDRSCTEASKKEAIVEIARSWYLFPELLSPDIDPAAYPDAASMLDALVEPARLQGKDRGWDFLTTIDASQTYYDEGQAAGYGFGLSILNGQLRVVQVFPGSAAFDAGFARGDEILQIGTDASTLQPVSGILAANGGNSLGDSLGPPSTEGITRVFEAQSVAGAASGAEPQVRTVTTRVFDLSPVSYSIDPATNVGIILLRTFVSTADAGLVSAAQTFKANGVNDVIVDVRYNGGGLVDTAELLANELSASHAGATMYALRNNAYHSDEDETFSFAPPAEAIQPLRIAFITTGATASASELVPNVLEPYLSGSGAPAIALVGSRTYGKPVGQRGWVISSCGDVLYLVSLKVVNEENEGDYFSGLPDDAVAPALPAFSGPLCDAQDDLAHAQGDPQEESTAAALYWLATGTCPPAPASSAIASVSPTEPVRYPAPPNPSIAQVHVPGLY